MNGEYKVGRLLDAALAVLSRAGVHTHDAGFRLVSAEVGSVLLTMRGKEGEGTDRTGDPSRSVSRYILHARAPEDVLTVAWGGGAPIEVLHFVRGGWERELLEHPEP